MNATSGLGCSRLSALLSRLAGGRLNIEESAPSADGSRAAVRPQPVHVRPYEVGAARPITAGLSGMSRGCSLIAKRARSAVRVRLFMDRTRRMAARQCGRRPRRAVHRPYARAFASAAQRVWGVTEAARAALHGLRDTA